MILCIFCIWGEKKKISTENNTYTIWNVLEKGRVYEILSGSQYLYIFIKDTRHRKNSAKTQKRESTICL